VPRARAIVGAGIPHGAVGSRRDLHRAGRVEGQGGRRAAARIAAEARALQDAALLVVFEAIPAAVTRSSCPGCTCP